MIKIYTKNTNIFLSYEENETLIREAETEIQAKEYLDSLYKKIEGMLSTEKMSGEEMLGSLMGVVNGLPKKERKLAEMTIKSLTKGKVK